MYHTLCLFSMARALKQIQQDLLQGNNWGMRCLQQLADDGSLLVSVSLVLFCNEIYLHFFSRAFNFLSGKQFRGTSLLNNLKKKDVLCFFQPGIIVNSLWVLSASKLVRRIIHSSFQSRWKMIYSRIVFSSSQRKTCLINSAYF